MRALAVNRNSPLPLYRQIKQALLAEIEQEHLGPGDRVPPEIELSKALGVSQITVIQALRELVKEGYLSRHRGRGTFVAGTVRQTVSVAMSDVSALTHQFFSQFMLGVEQEVQRSGAALQVFMTHGRSLQGAGPRALPSAGDRAGLIVCPAIPQDEVRHLTESGVLFVMVSTEYRDIKPPTVLSDDWSVGRRFGQYLVRKDCRRIGAILGLRRESGDPRTHLADRVLEGMRQAMGTDFGRVQERCIRRTDYTAETAQALMADLLAMREPPDGMVLFGDNAIRGAIEALRARGLPPGKPIVLVGYRDAPDKGAFPIPTLGHPVLEMGRRSVRLLNRIVRGERTGNPRVVVKPILDSLR